MLESFYWWIGMNVCTRRWIRHCLKCQARKIPGLTVRWSITSMPLPEGPGIAISVDYFGPLPVTRRGNTYILLITARFRRRTDMFAITAAEFTVEGTANILVNRYIPLQGYRGTHAPHTRTAASNSTPSFHKLSTSFWECVSLPQAPIIQTVTEPLRG